MVSLNELLEAIKLRRRTQSLFSREEYFELIGQVIEEHQASGLITDDDDIENIKIQLRAMWDEVKKED